MFKKMLIMKLEAEAKKDPAKADQMFNQAMGKFKNMSKGEQNELTAQFNEIYTMAKNMKCDNVIKYMDRFKKEVGV